MSEKSGAPAAEDDAGIPKADQDAAVKAARAEGRAEGEAAGAKAATDRLGAALSAEGVKGDAARMTAALDLAQKSPGMSGEDVAAFVVANVAGSKATGEADASAYEKSRLAAAGLAQPGAKGAEASQQAASRILANYRASTGSSAKQA